MEFARRPRATPLLAKEAKGWGTGVHGVLFDKEFVNAHAPHCELDDCRCDQFLAPGHTVAHSKGLTDRTARRNRSFPPNASHAIGVLRPYEEGRWGTRGTRWMAVNAGCLGVGRHFHGSWMELLWRRFCESSRCSRCHCRNRILFFAASYLHDVSPRRQFIRTAYCVVRGPSDEGASSRPERVGAVVATEIEVASYFSDTNLSTSSE
jgi:hypothetical protein